MATPLSQYLAEISGVGVAPFWLDVSAKATVLLLVAIAATALLRRSSAALRHRIWCTTFAALVSLPGLSAALPAWRLAVLPSVISPAGREESGTPALQAQRASAPARQEVAGPPARQTALPLAEQAGYEAPLRGETAEVETAAAHPPLNLMVLWLVGALVALGPLVAGLARTRLLRRQAKPIDDAVWTGLFDELRRRLALARRVRLVETEWPLVPMTWGVWRPVVMLPRHAREWTGRLRHFVLLHELAHVKRCDVAFQLLGRLTCALYWFHPLAWYALRRLRIERELACDDCVVFAGERATDYAAELLHIARSYRPAPFAAAVAMAQRSNLEHRVCALFDRACSHLPLSARAARLVLAGVMLLATVIAAVRLAPRAAADDDKQADVAASQSLRSESEGDLITVSGQVIDPRGTPVAGAHVFAVRWYSDSRLPHLPLAQTKSDAAGGFTISFRKSQFNVNVWLPEQWKHTQIVAITPGFGPQWVTWRDLRAAEELTLQLVADDVPIAGRVVDLEGRPIVGATIRMARVDAAKNDRLDAWLAAIARGELPDTAFREMRDELQTFDGWAPQTSTDKDGRFVLNGMGRERVVHLVVTSADIGYSPAIVVTRRTKPLSRRIWETTTTQFESVYGADFQLAAPPTQPITGTIRDAATHQPLAGVSVESTRLVGVWDSDRALRTVSDEVGRYRLTGMPKAKENEIIVVPNDDQPYFMREIKVPDQPGLDPIVIDVELERGIWVTGHVVDQATGEPVIAQLHYYPFLSNDLAQKAFGSSINVPGFENRYASRPDGSYRLVGLPGRAIVGADAIRHPYRCGVGADAIAGLNEHGTFDTYLNPIQPGIKWPHTLKEINPPRGVESVTCDLVLDPGESLTLHVTDADGQPLSGFEVEGRTAMFEPLPSPAPKTSVEVVNLGPAETRTVLIRHKGRQLAKVVRVRLTEHPERAMTVKLERSARVVGRLLDRNGDPVRGAAVTALVQPSGNFTKRLDSVTSDERGRFEYDIPTGCDYGLHAEAAGMFASVIRNLHLAPGETRDLGDVVAKSPK